MTTETLNVSPRKTDQLTQLHEQKKIVPKERGVKLIHNPVLNKGTGYTEEERRILGLKGLLPPRPIAQDLQADRIIQNLRKINDDLDKYSYLVSLQDRNENLFYYVVGRHLEELMPIIYTPTVGKACQVYGHIYRRPRGLYISIEDRGHIKEILLNWPHEEARVIVVTDGGRILGLGDLGVYGMGIPIGKLSLYTACAGIRPTNCLPITLDVGTNNKELLDDPLYLGHKHSRVKGEAFDAFIHEFITAVQEVFPHAVIQLEDFATENAFKVLNKYRYEARLFDDDIQGTASVALAGIFSATKVTGIPLTQQRILFLGAGEAGVGIGDIFTAALEDEGLGHEEAKLHSWFFDSKGLVCASRKDLAEHKISYAHEYDFTDNFVEAIKKLKPTAIVGVSGQPAKFTKEVIELMSEMNERPIIFALSNPTSKSECTAEEAYKWSDGKAIFASGSPFPPVEFKGRTIVPGQGNNVYIFPGIGLGLVHSKAKIVSERMFLEAARVLSDQVTEEELERGTIYPSFKRIKDVSALIAEAVTRIGIEEGTAYDKLHPDTLQVIKKKMYDPTYARYL